MCSESPVINGCSAKCCENFSFPFSPSDLQQMIGFIEENKDKMYCDRPKSFINAEGREIVIIYDPQVKQIADMLIYLGASEVDPQHPYYTKGELFRYANNLPEDFNLPKEKDPLYSNLISRFWEWNFVKDGEILGHTYTCKHFDTKKRICLNYENRPNMCINYGKGCKYEGCNFDKNAEKIFSSNLNQ